MWNEESCCQSSISDMIISRQGKHRSHDNVEEVEFGTKSNFIVWQRWFAKERIVIQTTLVSARSRLSTTGGRPH